VSAVKTNQKSEASNNVELATEVLVKHGRYINAVICSKVVNKAEAEDLFQDFFLFLISKPIPQDVRNVRGFLYRMVCDKIVDSTRRIEHYRTKMYNYSRCQIGFIDDRPENTVMEAEETERLFESIRHRLPPKEASAVTLRYRNNYDTGEVAERMEVKQRTVTRYVSTGLKKIRDFLMEE